VILILTHHPTLHHVTRPVPKLGNPVYSLSFEDTTTPIIGFSYPDLVVQRVAHMCASTIRFRTPRRLGRSCQVLTGRACNVMEGVDNGKSTPISASGVSTSLSFPETKGFSWVSIRMLPSSSSKCLVPHQPPHSLFPTPQWPLVSYDADSSTHLVETDIRSFPFTSVTL